MNWIRLIKPNLLRSIYLAIIALSLVSSYYGFFRVSGIPNNHGFPFTYKIDGCSHLSDAIVCVDEFYPINLVLNVIILTAIYVLLGYIPKKKSISSG